MNKKIILLMLILLSGTITGYYFLTKENNNSSSVETINYESKNKDFSGYTNTLVDLNNAISLKHTLPMGTHNLGLSNEDIELRFSKDTDTFIPMGTEEVETPNKDEVVYAVGNNVRTRRWAWRQSNEGKIDENTNFVFFPIDGFIGVNEKEVELAKKELEDILHKVFKCETMSGTVDKNNNTFTINI